MLLKLTEVLLLCSNFLAAPLSKAPSSISIFRPRLLVKALTALNSPLAASLATVVAVLAEVLLAPCTAELSVLAMVCASVRLRLAVLLPAPIVAVREGISTAVSSCRACRQKGTHDRPC